MGVVQTVIGEIKLEDMGKTLIHEHLRTRSEMAAFQFPRIYDEEFEYRKAVEEVLATKKYDVKTICDPTVMGLGRDIRFIQKVALETHTQIIAATGVFTFSELPTRFQFNTVEFLAEQFIKDIKEGIQNTSIKAGFLKLATDVPGVTPDVEKVIRAVAMAHHETQVPIMTHSHPATGTGLQQLKILMEEGVNPSNVLIGHTGDTDDLDYILKVLDTGAFIGLDRYGLSKILPTEKRNETAVELIKRGYTNKIFISQDYCCTSDRYKPDHMKKLTHPDWSMIFIFEEVLEELLNKGVTEADLKAIFYENPIAWFTYEK